MNRRFGLPLCLVFFVAACASTAPPPHHAHEHTTGLDAVAAVHGGAGPSVVAGYRMGEYALREFGLARGSFDLDVTHASPAEFSTRASQTAPQPRPARASAS